jgi:diguanylate cyclase (GGDEF)-like protein
VGLRERTTAAEKITPRLSAWSAYLVVGVLLAAAYFLTGHSNPVWLAIAASSAVALWIGTARVKRRLPWVWLAIGQTCYLIAEILWVAYDVAGEVPFPSFADIFYFAVYPFAAAGLYVLVRDRSPGRDLPAVIDAAVITVVMGLLAWVYLMEPYARDPSLSIMEIAISVAYPIGDLLLLGVLARLLVGAGGRSVALVLITAGTVAMLVSDVIFARVELTIGYEAGLIDLGWILNYICWGVAALHPSARSASDPIPAQTEQLTTARLATLAGVSLLAPAVLAGEWAVGAEKCHVIEVVLATATVFLLVVARMAGLNREIRNQVTTLTRQGKRLETALDERDALADRLLHQASHDPLTGLANRSLFMERVDAALEAAPPTGPGVAVLFLDLDDFKLVNDSYGHPAGDELLTALAQRLRGALRSGDIAARLGGDEFGILLSRVDDELVSRRVAGRVVRATRTPFNLRQGTVEIHSSAGVALGEPGIGAEQLVRNADAAMYLAKSKGKDRFEMFDLTKHSSVLEQISIKSSLPAALENGEFTVHYQPLIELASRATVGAEALVRWNHPERGLVFPSDFIGLAEESDFILSLGAWVIQQACRQAREWRDQMGERSPFTMSVNVSARQLAHLEFVDHVSAALTQSNLAPEHLVLEFTESVLMKHEDGAPTLAQLSALGVRFAIDDFGTGYSSLAYLRRLPADVLKIDKSFVDEILGGPEDEAVAHAVLRLGSILKKSVIAEGIEDERQRSRLVALGCKYGQGYLFSPPVEPERFTRLLTADGGRLRGKDQYASSTADTARLVVK